MIRLPSKEYIPIPEEHLRVVTELEHAPNGYITKDKLLKRLNLSKNSQRYLSSLINELVVDYGVLIGSTQQKGLFICKTPEDVYMAKKSLVNLNRGILERIDVLSQATKELT